MESLELRSVPEGDRTHSIVVSRPVEARKSVDGSLVSTGAVKNVGISLQFPSKSAEERLPLRFFMIFVVHPGQMQLLSGYERARPNTRRWSAFVSF